MDEDKKVEGDTKPDSNTQGKPEDAKKADATNPGKPLHEFISIILSYDVLLLNCIVMTSHVFYPMIYFKAC